MASQKVLCVVIPAQAGIQKVLKSLDSRLRGNDGRAKYLSFYEFLTHDYSFVNFEIYASSHSSEFQGQAW